MRRFYNLILVLLLGCTHESLRTMPDPPPPPPATTEFVDILALGDSYTKGESVPWTQNFPNQLADSLRSEGKKINGLRVIAQTGWRTDQLQNAVANAADIADSIFSLVTLCIGVNNQYQNASFDAYKTQFEQLLNTAIGFAGKRKDRVVVLSIPDWAYTPFGQNSANPAAISQKIDQYNAANLAIAQKYGVRYVNVTDISRNGLGIPALVAGDGLHPSAQQYTAWVRRLLVEARTMLAE